jgi:hypothetical protein
MAVSSRDHHFVYRPRPGKAEALTFNRYRQLETTFLVRLFIPVRVPGGKDDSLNSLIPNPIINFILFKAWYVFRALPNIAGGWFSTIRMVVKPGAKLLLMHGKIRKLLSAGAMICKSDAFTVY